MTGDPRPNAAAPPATDYANTVPTVEEVVILSSRHPENPVDNQSPQGEFAAPCLNPIRPEIQGECRIDSVLVVAEKHSAFLTRPNGPRASHRVRSLRSIPGRLESTSTREHFREHLARPPPRQSPESTTRPRPMATAMGGAGDVDSPSRPVTLHRFKMGLRPAHANVARLAMHCHALDHVQDLCGRARRGFRWA